MSMHSDPDSNEGYEHDINMGHRQTSSNMFGNGAPSSAFLFLKEDAPSSNTQHPLCITRCVSFPDQHRVAPKSETSGLIKCTLGNINHWENKQQNEQKLGTGVDNALSCLGDLLGPMSTLGDIGSYKFHFEMNLGTAGNG